MSSSVDLRLLFGKLGEQLPLEIGIADANAELLAGTALLREALAALPAGAVAAHVGAVLAGREPEPLRVSAAPIGAAQLHGFEVGEDRVALVLFDDSDKRMLERTQTIGRVATFRYNIAEGRYEPSDELYHLHGLDPATHGEMGPDDWFELLHPDDLGEVFVAVRHSLDTGEPVTVSARRRNKPEVVLEMHIETERGSDGTVISSWGTVRDISDLHRESERRRASDRLLRETERVGRVGSFDFSADGSSSMFSSGLFPILGGREGADTPLSMFEALQQVEESYRKAVGERLALLAGEDGTIDRMPLRAVRRSGGRDLWLEMSAESYIDPGDGTRHIRGTLRDVSTTMRVAVHHRELASFGLAALRLSSRPELVEMAIGVIARVLETGIVVMRAFDADGSLVVEAVRGWDGSGVDPQLGDPSRRSASGRAAVDLLPVFVDDYLLDPEVVLLPALERIGVRSSVAVPILGSNAPHGVITVHATDPSHFAADDVSFLDSLAAAVAATIERIDADAAVKDLAASRGLLVADTLEAEERARRTISEELHDGALQDLLAARQDLLEAEQNGPDPLVQAARAGVDLAVGQLRRAVHALHPVVLQHGGLEAALQAAGDQAAAQGRYTFRLDLAPAACGIADELVVSFTRELLTNVTKHASATTVAVAVRRAGDTLELEVSDDGRGADPLAVAAAPAAGHIGLASLRHRADAIGGTLELTAAANGTRALARFPIAGVSGIERPLTTP